MLYTVLTLHSGTQPHRRKHESGALPTLAGGALLISEMNLSFRILQKLFLQSFFSQIGVELKGAKFGDLTFE